MAWTDLVTRATSYVVTATNWNELVNNFKAIGDPWTAYTPTWSNAGGGFSLGNGTRTGSYMQAGKLVIAKMTLTGGSTTNYGSGTLRVSLPFPAKDTSDAPMGWWFIRDASAGVFTRTAYTGDGTTAFGITDAGLLVSNTSPMTWTTSDFARVQVAYEAA